MRYRKPRRANLCIIGEIMSASRVGRMCPVTCSMTIAIPPTSRMGSGHLLRTHMHPNLRQEHWPVTILPWYPCYTEHERHSAQGSIVVHDGLLPSKAGTRAPQHLIIFIRPRSERVRRVEFDVQISR